MIYYKIINFVIFALGGIFSFPILLLNRYTHFPTIKKNDYFDKWTFAHFYATLLIMFILYTFHMLIWTSALISFLVMYAYELFIDGLRLENP